MGRWNGSEPGLWPRATRPRTTPASNLKSPHWQRLSAREGRPAGHCSADGPTACGWLGTSRHSPLQIGGIPPAGWTPPVASPGPRCRRGQATHTRGSALLPRVDPPRGGRTPGTQPGRRGDPDARAPGRTSTSPGPTRPTVCPRSETTWPSWSPGLRVELTTTRHGGGDHGAHGTSRHLPPAATRLGLDSPRAHAHRM